MSYRLSTAVRPLIWIEAVVEPHSGSRIEYMIKAKSQFKQRSVANNVEVAPPFLFFTLYVCTSCRGILSTCATSVHQLIVLLWCLVQTTYTNLKE